MIYLNWNSLAFVGGNIAQQVRNTLEWAASAAHGTVADYTGRGPTFKTWGGDQRIKITSTNEQPITVQSFLVNHRDGIDGCDSTLRDDPKTLEIAMAEQEATDYKWAAAALAKARAIPVKMGENYGDSEFHDLNAEVRAAEVKKALAAEAWMRSPEAHETRLRNLTEQLQSKYGPTLPLQLAQGDALTIPQNEACGETLIEIDLHTNQGDAAYVFDADQQRMNQREAAEARREAAREQQEESQREQERAEEQLRQLTEDVRRQQERQQQHEHDAEQRHQELNNRYPTSMY
jgi:hypothetical protein